MERQNSRNVFRTLDLFFVLLIILAFYFIMLFYNNTIFLDGDHYNQSSRQQHQIQQQYQDNENNKALRFFLRERFNTTPYIFSRRDGSNRRIRLNEIPSLNATDEWLLELGYQKSVIGKTIQNRDINLYWMDYYYHSVPNNNSSSSSINNNDNTNVLFLSLVYGNEPMGLVSLLLGAKALALSSNNVSSMEHSPNEKNSSSKSIRIYLLPIVNVDGYEDNISHNINDFFDDKTIIVTRMKERRGNLRPTCNGNELSDLGIKMEEIEGVDLNRNFKIDWSSGKKCSRFYPGSKAMSEPETQAVADVVKKHKITHAISIHSRRNYLGQPLIIHPFGSKRSFDTMSKNDRKQYRDWSRIMNDKVYNYYRTGTAKETIQYTADGTDLDWIHCQNAVSFVIAAQPPCQYRFCRGDDVYENAGIVAVTMKNFVSLIVEKEKERWRPHGCFSLEGNLWYDGIW